MGKQAVGLLEKMGYTNVGYYVGGMSDWVENGGTVEKVEAPVQIKQPKQDVAPLSSTRVYWAKWLDVLANWSLQQLISLWLGMIIGFGLIY